MFLKIEIYADQLPNGGFSSNFPYDVVKRLITATSETRRSTIIDNIFTSVPLAKFHYLTMIMTLRKNKKINPKEFFFPSRSGNFF